jgi:hypothetical protein
VCSVAMAWTMERPRPFPFALVVRSVSSRWKGWTAVYATTRHWAIVIPAIAWGGGFAAAVDQPG